MINFVCNQALLTGTINCISGHVQGSNTIKPVQKVLPVLLLVLLCACSGSNDNSDDSGNTNDQTDITSGNTYTGGSTDLSNGDSTSGTTSGSTGAADSGNSDSSPSSVAASSLPSTNSDAQVTWPFDAIASDLAVLVQPFVELPLASNGSPARWNAMSSFGDRLFVVDEQDGRVYEVGNNTAQLWFDISNAVQSHTGRSIDINNPFHGGVRGIAFHPDFESNGKFYASIMEHRPADTSAHNYLSDNSGIDADSVLVEWTADTSSYEIDASSYRELFRVGVPEFDHPIKQIAFNPYLTEGDDDYGNLYIAHGDGSVESSLAGSGQGNDALGKILRINPLQSDSDSYTIPTDNPFIADASLPDEVYSYGHRNPHHLAFSTAGHLLATDAGRDNVDEINLVQKGNNYGWALREGAYVHLDEGTLVNGVEALPADDAINGFVYPVVQFGHHGDIGASFTGEALGGGFVVENGSELDGQFFFIDFPKTGLLFHARLSDILLAKTTGSPDELTVAQSYIAGVQFDQDRNPDTPALNTSLKEIVQSASGYINVNDRVDVRIFQGAGGELYLTSKRNNMMYIVVNSLPLE